MVREIGRILLGADGSILDSDDAARAAFGARLDGQIGDLLETTETGTTEWKGVEKNFSAEVLSHLSDDANALVMRLVQSGANHSSTDDLLHITADLVRSGSGGIDDAIVDALARIGRLTGVDRSYTFMFAADGETATNTHEWTRAGVEPAILQFQDVPSEPFAWFVDEIAQHGTVVVRSLNDVPDNAAAVRLMLESRQIRSLLGVGMFRDGVIAGFAGFDYAREENDWVPETVDHLSLVGELLIQSILRARSERELSKANETFRLIQEATNDVIWDWDVGNGIVRRSDALESLLGYAPSPETERPEWWTERIHPDDAALASMVLRDETEVIVQAEYRIRHRDGHWVHVLDRGLVVRDPGGRRVRMVGMATDISDRVRTLEKLRESEARFRAVVESISEVITIIDPSGRVVYQSPAASSALGRTPEELGRSAFEYVHPEDRDRVREILGDAIRNNRRIEETTFRYRHGDGRTITLETVGMNLITSEAIGGIVLVSRDITNRRRAEQQLERTHRLASIGHLASAIAHEFNNVLMGAQPFVDVIRRTEDPDKIQKAATRIEEAIQKGKTISRKLLQFSRPVSIALEKVDLRSWIRSIEPELRQVLRGDASLEITSGDEPLDVLADPDALQHATLNLLLWARDTMSRETEPVIDIALRRQSDADPLPSRSEDYILLVMRFPSAPLDRIALEHMFDPMYEAKEGRGSGLGLAVVKQLIVAMKGDVMIDGSDSTTIVRLCLPAVSLEIDPAFVHAGVQPSSDQILLVEDDEMVASGIIALLEIEGQSVALATTGAEAIERLRTAPPALMILDIGLPDMSGIELYEQIVRDHPSLPVIFSSGHGDQRDLEKYLKRPNIEFLLKPYDAATLLTLVERLLKNAG